MTESLAPQTPKPLLIYDGDCGFCRYWVDYWRKLTGGRVDYAPYQEVGGRFPDISADEFRGAIKYVSPAGKITSAAEASFRVLNNVPGKKFWLALYKFLPGFAAVSEWSYAFIARRRGAAFTVSRFLWGPALEPARFDNLSWIFLRLLGLLFFAAFVSFGVQAQGLIGSHGILPLKEFLDAVAAQAGPQRYWLLPDVFWLDDGDAAIQGVCWGGAVLSLLLTLNVLPRFCLVMLCGLYLSLTYAGQSFMTFQWDFLLIETGFVAFLMTLSLEPGVWLMRWLAFRFMFMGGAVKILSGDLTWRNFTALDYHFLTQPLPTPLAWYADHLPHGILAFGTFATLFIELGLPFLIFCPRRLRFIAAFGFILLQSVISITGNYNFFNLNTLLLCLMLFDDQALRKIIPLRRPHIPRAPKAVSYFVGFLGAWTILASAVQLDLRFGGVLPSGFTMISDAIEPFHVVNTYGPFSVMTTQRLEIVMEGSDDGINWKEYEFRYKPGDVTREPLWNIPHQPRLDWQMWFAALAPPQQSPWFSRFIERLLENQPEVTALLKNNPFPDKPPQYVRAALYDYRFTTPEERAKDGAWWARERKGLFFPEAKLR